MFKQNYTLLFISSRSSAMRRFHLPGWFLTSAVGGMTITLLIAIAASTYAWVLKREATELRETRSAYLHQGMQLRRVTRKMEDMQSLIQRLNEMDFKLRLITGLDRDPPATMLYGVGNISGGSAASKTADAKLARLDTIDLLHKDLGKLANLLISQEERFNELKAHLADRRDIVERTPYRRPLKGFISSHYGMRSDPFTGQMRMHEGIDIVAPTGTPVRAPANGIVTFSSVDGGMGRMVVLDHGYGVVTRYGHHQANLVRAGQRVQRGDIIATVGSSGHSTGPHLHYEIRIHDRAVDPRRMFLD